MPSSEPEGNKTTEEDLKEKLDDIVSTVDTGAREVTSWAGKFLALIALSWSLFQLWIASPFPYMFADWIPLLNSTHTRSAHLGFAMFLAFVAFPALKRSPRKSVPIQDWIFALTATCSALYIAVFSNELADRPGLPILQDLVLSGIGLVFLLEATRRSLGLPMMCIALLFLSYVFFGENAPEIIAWKGASFNKAMSHMWLSQEGVFGIGLGVSTGFIFLFVLFGALLEKAGAGNYFTKVAFALLGHYRGGPAKAAVVSSGMNGMISGSSIANVVITGTFTIPLMKRVGFSPEKAGAVEVAASTNGQLMPPIMGAAAFLMIEYVGISYLEVIKHAFLPAVISYIALVYIVHLEALKADLKSLKPRKVTTLFSKIITFLMVIISIVVLSGIIYFGFGWVKTVAGDASPWIAGIVILLVYIGLIRYSIRYPDLEIDDHHIELTELPETGPTVKSGLHYLLPVVVLIWCLIVERFSPGLAAFWATMIMIFIISTQRSLKVFFRDHGNLTEEFHKGLKNLIDGLIFGARNMIGIGVATATAGIIVGSVTLTGIGLVMTEFVEFISGGNLVLILIFTAFICLLLGMGLPTTANYIVVSTLMAPVIVTLGAQNGLIVPLIAVHMFVFYFGILADDTPPVGLAAFAASAIAHSDPIRTGIQGFTYDIRTGILPFLFIFNTELLMIGIESWWHLLLTLASAVMAMLMFAAATQGFFFVKSRWWETIALLLISFTLFRPGFWWDMLYPPNQIINPSSIYSTVEKMPADSSLQLHVEGENLEGRIVSKMVVLSMGIPGSGTERLERSGLVLREEGKKIVVDTVVFDSSAEKSGIDFDWEILSLQIPVDQPPKQWMYFPALLLFGLVVYFQRRRSHLRS
ncbi:MAG: C4-dicarboxylate ABC transporter [Deltaproteobacteria bacterium]|jgi:TRAP transporter 4TM/12TM fusion protein|nr:C4-dicarboxylate ABC transporter [Deltaproteobacteria bacterium]